MNWFFFWTAWTCVAQRPGNDITYTTLKYFWVEWYARSAEFMQTPLMDKQRWLRITGDIIFAAGIIALAWFVIGLKTGWSINRNVVDVKEE